MSAAGLDNVALLAGGSSAWHPGAQPPVFSLPPLSCSSSPKGNGELEVGDTILLLLLSCQGDVDLGKEVIPWLSKPPSLVPVLVTHHLFMTFTVSSLLRSS